MKNTTIASFVLAGFVCTPAFAVEAFKTYDNFSTAPINGALWEDAERTVQIKAGVLAVTQRAYGQGSSNVGVSFDTLHTHFSEPAAVTEVRAKITVKALEVNACPGNPSVSQSRARINGSYYNIGTPVPGSEVGDALAQVKLTRFSNSTDAPGVLRVQGSLLHCINADCSTSTTIKTIDLGTVNLGQAATVQVQWDQPNKQFLYSRDSGAFSGSIVYTDDDSHPPGLPFKSLDSRIDVANCTAPATLTGFVSATFDSVAVNKSAAP